MDTNTAIVVVVGLLAVVAVSFLLVFRGRGKVKLKGPFKTGLEMHGSNDPAPGIRGEDLTSEKGGLTAHDKTGRGVDVKTARTQKDINLILEAPPEDPDPKG
jgi:hypothetical protein